jgi:hypothetical protein
LISTLGFSMGLATSTGFNAGTGTSLGFSATLGSTLIGYFYSSTLGFSASILGFTSSTFVITFSIFIGSLSVLTGTYTLLSSGLISGLTILGSIEAGRVSTFSIVKPFFIVNPSTIYFLIEAFYTSSSI